MVGKMYFTKSFHDQHLITGAYLSAKSKELGACTEVGKFWTPIPP
jgi:hypothetical protein